ncbi:hypothetical protein GJ496_004565 [Pomphorhynchus laevis]|nr:hypothetical protein GJ496_004565 [Pomphorhynchus laevis]
MASLIWQTISGLMNFSTKPPDKSSSVEFFTESHSDHELDKSVHGSHVNSERSHFGCIYFASQTGTSSRLAAKLKQLIEYQCDTIKYKIIDLSSVQSVSNLCNGVSIFIVSTYGIGQPPDSARHFFNSLSVSTTAALNSNVQYAIFGVGDSQYRCYNASSKYLSKHFARISQWSEMVPLTLGDSSHSIVSDFYNWTAILWPAIRRNTHIESLSLDTFQFDERPLYRLSISRHVSTKPYTTNFSSRIHTTQSVQQKGPFTENNPYYALVHSKAQLFSSDRRCWAIEFDLEESPLR